MTDVNSRIDGGAVRAAIVALCLALSMAWPNAAASQSQTNGASQATNTASPAATDSAFLATPKPAQPEAPPTQVTGTLTSDPHSAALVALAFGPSPEKPTALTVSDPKAAAKLAQASIGDQLTVTVDSATHPTTIEQIDLVSRPVGRAQRVLALVVAAFLVFVLACVGTWWRPQSFLIGFDGRYSNSQTQLALWSGALATVYLATVGLRIGLLHGDFIGGVNIPMNLIALTGLSALSFGGAKAITVSKVDAAAAPPPVPDPNAPVVPAAQRAAPSVKTTAAKPQLRDLVMNDAGRADLGDFQMIMITVVAIVIFMMTAFHFLGALRLETPTTLPDIDTTLLATFGIGQGAYLGKKAASKLGEG